MLEAHGKPGSISVGGSRSHAKSAVFNQVTEEEESQSRTPVYREAGVARKCHCANQQEKKRLSKLIVAISDFT